MLTKVSLIGFFIFSIVAISASLGDYVGCQGFPDSSSILPYATIPDGFCPFVLAKNLNTPRGLFVVENGDVLVVEQGSQQVTVLWIDSNNVVQKAKLASAPGLNHAVTVHNNYLYASSSTTVYRWKYNPAQRSDLGTPQVVINSIPCCHHVSRSLIFDSKGFLYVQSGSGSNVDPDSTHSRIMKFDLKTIPNGGINWNNGKLFADGLRNEVGLRFDRFERLWGVENGCDDLYRSDLGGDIHTTNPSEEINLFATEGKFYGYPYCWSEGKLNRSPSVPGTQWVHPNFMNKSPYSDSWCKNSSNVVIPAYNLPAHAAPMDILFWNREVGHFPSKYHDSAFVSLHGSWDRQPPFGYKVQFVSFDQKSSMPVADSTFLAYNSTNANGPNWPHRPVGLGIAPCPFFGVCLLITSDASGLIIAVGYNSN